MTEEIIIDGVNVAECGYYYDTFGHCDLCGIGTDRSDTFCLYCKDNTNCYYKQLKRLEQENKELKECLKVYQRPDIVKVLTDYRTGELQLQENKLNNYRSALEEIREDIRSFYGCEDSSNDYKLVNMIDKINEVLK